METIHQTLVSGRNSLEHVDGKIFHQANLEVGIDSQRSFYDAHICLLN